MSRTDAGLCRLAARVNVATNVATNPMEGGREAYRVPPPWRRFCGTATTPDMMAETTARRCSSIGTPPWRVGRNLPQQRQFSSCHSQWVPLHWWCLTLSNGRVPFSASVWCVVKDTRRWRNRATVRPTGGVIYGPFALEIPRIRGRGGGLYWCPCGRG